MQSPILRPTRWLAHRLGLSVSTVERLRAAGSTDLPPAIMIGRSIRYDENLVEKWLQERATSAARTPVPSSSEGSAT